MTRDLVEATSQEATARGEGVALAICAYARAVLCNGLGEYEEALSAAVLASEYEEVVVENWGLCELFEPAAELGRRDVADKALERLAMKAAGDRHALGARHPGALAGLAQRRRRRRRSVPRSARALAGTRIRSEVARTHCSMANGSGTWADAPRRGRAADGA